MQEISCETQLQRVYFVIDMSDLPESSTTFVQQKSYNSVSSGKSGLAISSGAFVLTVKVSPVNHGNVRILTMVLTISS